MARKHKMMRNPKRHWKPRMLPWFANRPSQQGSLQHWTSLRITRKMVCFRVNCTSSVRIFTFSSSSSSLDEVQIVRASIYRLLKNEKLQNSDLKLRWTSWSKNFYPDWLWRNHFPSKLLWRFARAMREVVILAGRQCVCVIFYYSKFMKNNPNSI